ncbi:MAG: hypothetical protein IPP69_07830 [Flavobacteriales bacterium]|nr:hypothetical protein [Flavobacteriales bacterium]
MEDTKKILLRLERMERTQLALFATLRGIERHLNIIGPNTHEAFNIAKDELSMLDMNISESFPHMHGDPREHE